jgi:hypothetical protein
MISQHFFHEVSLLLAGMPCLLHPGALKGIPADSPLHFPHEFAGVHGIQVFVFQGVGFGYGLFCPATISFSHYQLQLQDQYPGFSLSVFSSQL